MAGWGDASVDSFLVAVEPERMNTDTHTIVISGDRITGDPAHLTLQGLRRQNDTDYWDWDGNGVVTRFHAAVPGFRADFTEHVHLRQIVELREALAKMYTTLEGRLEWKGSYGFLELVAEMDRSGHIRWTIELNYPMYGRAKLSLEIQNDQTYLPEILSQIDGILDAFPVVGTATEA